MEERYKSWPTVCEHADYRAQVISEPIYTCGHQKAIGSATLSNTGGRDELSQQNFDVPCYNGKDPTSPTERFHSEKGIEDFTYPNDAWTRVSKLGNAEEKQFDSPPHEPGQNYQNPSVTGNGSTEDYILNSLIKSNEPHSPQSYNREYERTIQDKKQYYCSKLPLPCSDTFTVGQQKVLDNEVAKTVSTFSNMKLDNLPSEGRDEDADHPLLQSLHLTIRDLETRLSLSQNTCQKLQQDNERYSQELAETKRILHSVLDQLSSQGKRNQDLMEENLNITRQRDDAKRRNRLLAADLLQLKQSKNMIPTYAADVNKQ